MPIAINGSGTITGLSTGGLPDGSVDADTLASNAVTTVKINDDAVTDAKQSISGTAKAWVCFDGTTGTLNQPDVTILAHFNVASVTDNGTGLYTVTFTNGFSDTNYAVVGTTASTTTTSGTANTVFAETSNGANRTTSSFQLRTQSSAGSNADREVVSAAVFGG